MPTYEYACRSCGHRLDVVQSFSDAPLTECPSCGGHLRKVLHAPGIAFKGSGFYKTDSRSSSPSGPSKAATAASSDAAPSAGGSDSSGGSSDGGSAPAPATPAPAPAAAP